MSSHIQFKGGGSDWPGPLYPSLLFSATKPLNLRALCFQCECDGTDGEI